MFRLGYSAGWDLIFRRYNRTETCNDSPKRQHYDRCFSREKGGGSGSPAPIIGGLEIQDFFVGPNIGVMGELRLEADEGLLGQKKGGISGSNFVYLFMD